MARRHYAPLFWVGVCRHGRTLVTFLQILIFSRPPPTYSKQLTEWDHLLLEPSGYLQVTNGEEGKVKNPLRGGLRVRAAAKLVIAIRRCRRFSSSCFLVLLQFVLSLFLLFVLLLVAGVAAVVVFVLFPICWLHLNHHEDRDSSYCIFWFNSCLLTSSCLLFGCTYGGINKESFLTFAINYCYYYCCCCCYYNCSCY